MEEIRLFTVTVDLSEGRDRFRPLVEAVMERSDNLTRKADVPIPEDLRWQEPGRMVRTECTMRLGCPGGFDDLVRMSNDTPWEYLGTRENGHIPVASHKKKKIKVKPASFFGLGQSSE
ncbi:hypothetical protein ACFL2C_00455 [Patescibacteria group bacterium]